MPVFRQARSTGEQSAASSTNVPLRRTPAELSSDAVSSTSTAPSSGTATSAERPGFYTESSSHGKHPLRRPDDVRSVPLSLSEEGETAGGCSRDREIWLLDTETTGLSPSKCRIVEIAILRYGPERSSTALSWLVNPGTAIPRAASNVHGISDSTVKGAKNFSEVWPDVLEAVHGRDGGGNSRRVLHDIESNSDPGRRASPRPIIVAHNASFDRGFVEAELERAGLALPAWDWACSMRRVAREAWPGQSAKLASLASNIGITDFGHHRAGADVEALAKVLDAAAWVLAEKNGADSSVEALTDALERSAAEMRPSAARSRPGVKTRAAARRGKQERAPAEVSARESAGGERSRADASSRVDESQAISIETESSHPEGQSQSLVYCVQGGKVWHTSLSCGRLASSTNVDALTSPPADRRICSVCAEAREPEKCCVCLEPLVRRNGEGAVESDDDVCSLPCGHVLHASCASALIGRRHNCPICRASIPATFASTLSVIATSPVTPDAASSSLSSAPEFVSAPRSPFYGTSSGACYHVNSECYGLRTARVVEQVSSSGRRPCRVCVGESSAPSLSQSDSSNVGRASFARRLDFGDDSRDSLQAGAVMPRSSFSSADASRSVIGNVVHPHCFFVARTGSVWHTVASCAGLRKAAAVLRVSTIPHDRRPCRLCGGESLRGSAIPGNPVLGVEFRGHFGGVTESSAVSSVRDAPAARPSRSLVSRPEWSRESFFIAPTGKVWHVESSCAGLRSASTVSQVSSLPSGRRPCKLCAI